MIRVPAAVLEPPFWADRWPSRLAAAIRKLVYSVRFPTPMFLPPQLAWQSSFPAVGGRAGQMSILAGGGAKPTNHAWAD